MWSKFLFSNQVKFQIFRRKLPSSNIFGYLQKYNNIRLKSTALLETIKLRGFESIDDTKIRRIIGVWLATCSGIVFLTIVVGGLTRLTESGLSMVNWHLFKEFPPLSNEQWQKEFQNYQQYPEFALKNSQITLSEFQWIWYMEYIHRMLGRTTGLVFVLPALYFAQKGWIKKIPALKKRLWVYMALLGFQGLLGWYMVKSGLTSKTSHSNLNVGQFENTGHDVPRVSQYRLAAHLGTAFILYALMLWASMGLLTKPMQNSKLDVKVNPLRLIRRWAHASKSLIFVTALSGAFVAGLDAGLVYSNFPKMGDSWIPEDVWALKPAWKNFFENPATVQLDHRILATLTLSSVAVTWWLTRRIPRGMINQRLKLATNCMLGMTGIQVTLGICTLLYQVPVWLASFHQTGSLVLLSNAIWLTHELRRIPKL